MNESGMAEGWSGVDVSSSHRSSGVVSIGLSYFTKLQVR